MARYNEDRPMRGRRRDEDRDRRDVRYAYERYSGSQDRAESSSGGWFGDSGYDPDHAYRPRRAQGRYMDVEPGEQPYAQRPYPGGHGDRQRVRGQGALGRERRLEEHAWRWPSSWYGGVTGAYRGVGPKGYVRSDERIRDQVCDLLMDAPEVNAADIEVEVKDGEVTLTGTLESRRAKRRAEDLAEHAVGVKDVHNRIRIAGQGGA